ncbi:MAG TPA: winged helix-turn-helix domain-containing protein [Roseiflexaceae bacterium]|nr:winged helix-turn-helix domain-containing protein [Roseiflexaceae bacterium]
MTELRRAQLKELISAGSQAASYATDCWATALIQNLIARQLGRLYNVYYLGELLRTLGFSHQKARFVSDHLDEAKRQAWRQSEWPAIVRQARQRDALLLFADEASFAQRLTRCEGLFETNLNILESLEQKHDQGLYRCWCGGSLVCSDIGWDFVHSALLLKERRSSSNQITHLNYYHPCASTHGEVVSRSIT